LFSTLPTLECTYSDPVHYLDKNHNTQTDLITHRLAKIIAVPNDSYARIKQ